MDKTIATDFIEMMDAHVKQTSNKVIVPNVYYKTQQYFYRHTIELIEPKDWNVGIRLNYGMITKSTFMPLNPEDFNKYGNLRFTLHQKPNMKEEFLQSIDMNLLNFVELEAVQNNKFSGNPFSYLRIVRNIEMSENEYKPQSSKKLHDELKSIKNNIFGYQRNNFTSSKDFDIQAQEMATQILNYKLFK